MPSVWNWPAAHRQHPRDDFRVGYCLCSWSFPCGNCSTGLPDSDSIAYFRDTYPCLVTVVANHHLDHVGLTAPLLLSENLKSLFHFSMNANSQGLDLVSTIGKPRGSLTFV